MRATCVRDGDAITGQSGFFELTPGETTFIADGATFTEGDVFSFSVNANDDAALASVELSTDTGFFQAFPDPGCSASLQVPFTTPLDVTEVVLTARAIDAVPNEASARVTIVVQADPPPQVSITAPQDGDTLIEGTTVVFQADATDNVAVTRVEFRAGGFAESDGTAPYEVELRVPDGINQLTFEASAFDNLGREAVAAAVVVNVIPDPLTTVVGLVRDSAGNPVEGAVVTTVGNRAGITEPDGSFSIPDVPTILGDIFVVARLQANSGRSSLFPPVRGGVTNVGIIVVEPLVPRALVVSLFDNTLRTLDLLLLRQSASLDLPRPSSNIAVSADGTIALVTRLSPPHTLTTIDLTIDPPQVLGQVAVPFAGSLEITDTADEFVLVAGTNRIASFDFSNPFQPVLVTNLSLGGSQAVAVTPDGSSALIAVTGDDLVRVVNIDQNGVLTDTGQSIATGNGPINATISPDGTRALVVHAFEVRVAILSITNGTVAPLGHVVVGAGLQASVFTPNGRSAYVLPGQDRGIGVLDIDVNGVVSDSGTRIFGHGPTFSILFLDQIAATPDGADSPEALFLLSTVDAAPTHLMDLGNGDDGETLAFNPDDGLIYHASGTSERNIPDGTIFESIAVDTLSTSDILLSGEEYNEAIALTYLGNSVFIGADLSRRMFRITTGGVVSALAAMDHRSKGLAFAAKVGGGG